MKNGGDVIGGFFSGGAENVPVPSQRARAEEVSSSEVFFATSLQQCRGVLTQYISFTTLSMPPISRKRTAEQKRSNSPAHSDAPSEEEPSAVIDPPSSVHVTPLRQLASAGRKPAASTKQLQEAAEEEIARLQDRIAVVEASLAREKVPVTGKQQLYFQCAPVLYEGASRLPNEEAPEWYQTLLPETQSTWNFPPFEPKNGHLGDVFDQVHQNLRDKAAEVKGDLRITYEGYIEEWKLLRQSILYTVLVGGALAQINYVIAESEGAIVNEGTSDLLDCLELLETIVSNLASDQIKRASVILFASLYTAQGAKKIVTAVQDTAVGFHPELLKAVREQHQPKDRKKSEYDSDPADATKEESQFSPRKSTATTWKPPTKPRDGPTAPSKNPSKLPSPRKHGGGKGG